MGAVFPLLRSFWSLTWGLLWVGVLHHLWRKNPSAGTWVIGGHRGRLYADNPAAIEAEARRRGKDIIWIANPDLAEELAARGLRVLRRQSWAARRAISRAAVLLYSHGEDDLDLQLILLRGHTAPRVYVDHCMGLVKGGGVLEPTLQRAPFPIRAIRTWLITRWDYVLFAAESIRAKHRLCYPMNPTEPPRGRLNGGAHLDAWSPGLDAPAQKRIYWFPTFRETEPARERLRQTIAAVVKNARLRWWLEENNYRFYIGCHINDPELSLQIAEPFCLGKTAHLPEEARSSELYISDYSGTIYDFLLLCRPQILFRFDEEDYKKRRHLLDEDEPLDFALHVRAVEQLVETLVSEGWRKTAISKAAERCRHELLPPPAASYAALSVREIDEILSDLESES